MRKRKKESVEHLRECEAIARVEQTRKQLLVEDRKGLSWIKKIFKTRTVTRVTKNYNKGGSTEH